MDLDWKLRLSAMESGSLSKDSDIAAASGNVTIAQTSPDHHLSEGYAR